MMTIEERAKWLEYFKTELMTRYYGIQLLHWDTDYVEAEIEVGPKINNFGGMPHGGALLGISEMVAGWVTMADGSACVTQNCSMRFLSSTSKGKVHFRGEAIYRDETKCIVRVEAKNDNKRLLVSGDFLMFMLDDVIVEKYEHC